MSDHQPTSKREVEVVITPSPAQYEQLLEHLDTLRGAGAASNTAAILRAVGLEAERVAATDAAR